MRLVRATHEEEALAIDAAFELGGSTQVLIVQNAGLLSMGAGMVCLAQRYQFPLLMLVSYRGTTDDPVFYHIPKGRATEPVIQGLGLAYVRADRNKAIGPQLRRAATYADESSSPIAVLLSRRIYNGRRYPPQQSRLLQVLAGALPSQTLVVTALGNASYLWAAMHHTPENFYIEDAMGLALPLALGLAIAQPARRVVVRVTERSSCIWERLRHCWGIESRQSHRIADLKNGVHAASGGQALTSPTLDLAQLARAAGIVCAANVATSKDFASALNSRF